MSDFNYWGRSLISTDYPVRNNTSDFEETLLYKPHYFKGCSISPDGLCVSTFGAVCVQFLFIY